MRQDGDSKRRSCLENPRGRVHTNMQAMAGELARRKFARKPDPGQLQAIILAVTGELCTLTSPGDPDRLDQLPAAHVMTRLELALVRERGKARSGHRSYDFNRHVAIHQALATLKDMAGRRGQTAKEKPAR